MSAYLNETENECFGSQDPDDPDLASVEAFLEACHEDKETHFNWEHLAVLSRNLRRARSLIRAELEAAGLKFQERPNVRRIRTLNDNPHDRWFGNPCAGGSGWEQIEGFAGREG